MNQKLFKEGDLQKTVSNVCDKVITIEYDIEVELIKKHTASIKELEREIAYFRAITGIEGPIIGGDGRLLEHKVDLSHDPEFMKMLTDHGLRRNLVNHLTTD